MGKSCRAALLLVHEPQASGVARSGLDELGAGGFLAQSHALSGAALLSDRAALAELDHVLAGCARSLDVAPEGLGLLGFARGGSVAFHYACTRRVAAAVDVEGPVLHPALSCERPTQPLELALNLEGSFLGLFGAAGPVAAEERELLRARLTAAARPFELVVLPGGEIVVDPGGRGYDEARAKELWRRVRAFLRAALAGDDEP